METRQNDEAKIAQREYMRKWRSEHPEKVKAAQKRYWAKKAAEMRTAAVNQEDQNKGD